MDAQVEQTISHRANGTPVAVPEASAGLRSTCDSWTSARLMAADRPVSLWDATRRRELGAWYTPEPVVAGILDLVLEPMISSRLAHRQASVSALRILDPSCGNGNFLTAAGHRIERALVDLGIDARQAKKTAFGSCVFGVDIDPDAVEACRQRLGAAGAPKPEQQVVVADSLALEPAEWSELFSRWGVDKGLDAVIGNPPFLSRLARDTAPETDRVSLLRTRFGDAAKGYANPASLFLLLASGLVADRDSVVALLQPLSLLSARDSARTRSALLERMSLEQLWVADQRVFDAGVDVCTPILKPGDNTSKTILIKGTDFTPAGSCTSPVASSTTWSNLLASVRGVPDCELQTAGVLGDLAEATADFRDQYYGIADHVRDLREANASMPPLITSGLIDPAHNRWGTSTRFAKKTYRYPRVCLAELSSELQRWADSRLVPKLLLSTQTRVLESVVDIEGAWLPSVPVITVTAKTGDLWRIAAVLAAPPTTMIALRRHQGSALGADALKLRAQDVLELPLPVDQRAWDEAAQHFEQASAVDDQAARRAHLLSCGLGMCHAYRVENYKELVDWWAQRLPNRN